MMTHRFCEGSARKHVPVAGRAIRILRAWRACGFHLVAPVMCAALCVALVGCGREPTQFAVTSYLNAEAPEQFVERFPDGTFKLDTLKNHQIAFEIPPSLVRVPRQPSSAPAMIEGDTLPAETAEAFADEVWVSQIVLIDVLWRARPGKTFAESTQSNANIVYCLITGDSAVTYEGSGFVYFEEDDGGEAIAGRLESSTLYPARFVGKPNDLFGPCRVVGTFTARSSGRETTRLQQRVRQMAARRTGDL